MTQHDRDRAPVLISEPILRGNLDRVVSRLVAMRIKAGHDAERIRREVPTTAARMAEQAGPDKLMSQESIAAYVRHAVERELATAPAPGEGSD